MEVICSTVRCTICGFDTPAPHISVAQIHDESDVQIANIKPLRHQTIVNSVYSPAEAPVTLQLLPNYSVQSSGFFIIFTEVFN